MSGQHTPTPWSFSGGFILAGGDALPIVGVQVPMVVGPKRLQAVENSKFIVQAVNSYDSNRATIEALVGALEKVKHWATQRCPCNNEEPDPCPLCGASVENLEACKAIEETFPRHLLADIDSALRLARGGV